MTAFRCLIGGLVFMFGEGDAKNDRDERQRARERTQQRLGPLEHLEGTVAVLRLRLGPARLAERTVASEGGDALLRLRRRSPILLALSRTVSSSSGRCSRAQVSRLDRQGLFEGKSEGSPPGQP